MFLTPPLTLTTATPTLSLGQKSKTKQVDFFRYWEGSRTKMNALLHLLTILFLETEVFFGYSRHLDLMRKIFGPSDSDTKDDEKSGDEKPKK